MPGERRLRILTRLFEGPRVGLEPPHLCRAFTEITGLTGAGLTLSGGGAPSISLGASDAAGAALEELQFVLGEGPGIDAHHQDHPVLAADLGHPAESRWPAYRDQALAMGVCAVFAFPLRVGAINLGALTLHRDRSGAIDDEQHADALVAADLAAETILLLQADVPPGTLAVELAGGAALKLVVHQASGMVAAQLEVSVGEALIRMRARAYAEGRSVDALARSVVDRTLRFVAGDDEGTAG